MLEIAERAVGLRIVLQRRTSCGNRFLQNGADAGGQLFALVPVQRASLPERGQSGPMQCLADIDIAETRNLFLVEQGGFQRGGAARQGLCQLSGIE